MFAEQVCAHLGMGWQALRELVVEHAERDDEISSLP